METNATLLPLGPMARRLGVTTKWLRAEAKNGKLPHLKAGDRLLFEEATVMAILVERAKKGGHR